MHIRTHTRTSPPQEFWLYGRRDNSYGAIVRKVGRILLSVSIQPQLDGKDKATVTQMSGATVFEKTYGMRHECKVVDLLYETHSHMVGQGKCTCQCHLEMIRPGDMKPLHGNVILKHAKKDRKPTQLLPFDSNHTSNGVRKRQVTLRRYLKKKTD